MEINRNKHYRCKEYWIERGYSEKEAIEKIKSEAFLLSKKRITKHMEKYDIGHPFGKWTLKSKTFKRSEELNLVGVYWFAEVKCECEEVGYRKILDLESGVSSGCRTCTANRKHKNGNWSGYKDLTGSLFNHYQRSASARDIEFTVSRKYLYELYLKQNGKCSLSGLPMSWKEVSLDRIDNARGYHKNNVQWVHKIANVMKHVMDIETLLAWCTAIIEYQKINPIIKNNSKRKMKNKSVKQCLWEGIDVSSPFKNK